MKFKTVILAAGVSRRLGFNKLLLRIDGEEVILRSVRPFLSAGVDAVYVVASEAIDEIRVLLQGLPVELIHNPRYREGMSSSVRAALPFVGDADGVFFHLGDKPFVTEAVVNSMCGLFGTRRPGIVVPVAGGVKGHPVLVDIGRYRVEAEELEGDKGLREIIEKHSGDVICIEGDEGNIFDIDTVESIAILREKGYSVEKGQS